MQINRANIDQLLDAGMIEACGRNDKWYSIRRNGMTKKWKKDTDRIAIPCKVGFNECFTITEANFASDGELYPLHFRCKE